MPSIDLEKNENITHLKLLLYQLLFLFQNLRQIYHLNMLLINRFPKALPLPSSPRIYPKLVENGLTTSPLYIAKLDPVPKIPITPSFLCNNERAAANKSE